MTYLLVDDYPAARTLVRDLLETPEGHFVEAGNGCEAITAFSTHHPDWVIMDIDMPEMDGLDATREICTQDPKARIVMVTQHDAPEMRTAATAAGACAFINKADILDLPSLLKSLA